MKPTRFLQDASHEQLREAAALNHTGYFGQAAETGGEDAFPSETYDWSPHSWNDGREAVVPYPRCNPSALSADLSRFMAECRRQRIEVVSVWTLGAAAPPGLAPALLAQGFGPAGPHPILALDLAQGDDRGADPDGLRVERVEDEASWDRIAPRDLPNRRLRHRDASTNADARRSWHFAAWLGDRPVGHVQLLVTRGPLGVAGLYSFGVAPGAGERGAGTAVLRAACRHARDLGCGSIVLIDPGERPDPALGFEAVGQGRSWWIQKPEIGRLPKPSAVAFVEAVGQGDTPALDRLAPASLPADLDRRLLCGLTPLQVAALTRQSGSAEWLLGRGATPDLISLWDLGWEEQLFEVLSRQAGLVNRRFGGDKRVPLHVAVDRDDARLVRFLLEHGADPSLEDARFHSTPLGWAQHLERSALIPLLEAHTRPG